MKPEDEEALSAYQTHPDYLAHYAVAPNSQFIVASAIEWAQEDPRTNFQYAVVLESDESFIGCAGLRQTGYPPGEAEIGVEIKPQYWRRGFAREVLSELLQFGASRLGITVFWAETAASNAPAQALVEEFGFSRADSIGDLIRLKLWVGG
jgi:RimJ/RimL family protein N-acetyltransferase